MVRLEFHRGSVGNFRSPGNEISQGISWEFSFPGERNFTGDQLGIFVPRGTEFHSGSVGNFRSPGNEISQWFDLKIFVPRETKFHGGSVEDFRSPGNGISQWISW